MKVRDHRVLLRLQRRSKNGQPTRRFRALKFENFGGTVEVLLGDLEKDRRREGIQVVDEIERRGLVDLGGRRNGCDGPSRSRRSGEE